MSISSKDIKYWVGFNLIHGIGRVKLTQLENHFDSLERGWRATPAELKQAGLDCNSIRAIILEELNLTAVAHQVEMKGVIPASDTESCLLKQLSAEPTHIDEVCRSNGLPVLTVSRTLAMMEN